jgi:predicted DNA-binding protein (UPF0251 family)
VNIGAKKMPRRKKCRNITEPPLCNEFKPKGVPSRFLERVILTLDEYESLRLSDYEGLEHQEASEKMGVSRSIFTRLLQGAHLKVASALVKGAVIVIEGGVYHFQKKRYRCLTCYALFDTELNSDDVHHCPECSSEDVENLNNKFGMHGLCKSKDI